ncbi:cytochrome P450 4C1 isoform X1 [Manduca sexta]|uniref:cytochrome P450 4C1 isoform X1 n=1 Tax=Manduca sexta TaxID=7130 RepID=UPI00188DC9DC|nr:cytochrome P450 4C1 isoform X1 [Manduca sexta]
MLCEILIIFSVLWLAVHRWHRRRMFALWKQLKNQYTMLPFIGHAYMFFGSDEHRMKMFQRLGLESIEKGGIMGLWQGSRFYIMIADPVNAEFVLKTCLEKDDVMKCSRLLTGNGSVFAPVHIWRPRRKFLAPTFSPKNLMNFVKIFSKQSTVMVDNLKKAAGTGTFPIWKYITSYSMDSVCETTLGVQVNAQKQSALPFLKAFEEICKMDSARICKPWLQNESMYRLMPAYTQYMNYKAMLCNFIDQVIKSKRKSLEEEKQKAEPDQKVDAVKTFLELLIDSSGGEKGFNDVELQEETLVMVLAGTDTSAAGAAFATVMLSKHPDVQDKVYKELQEVFGDSDRPIVAEDLPRLKYLDAVVKETLRLYPSVPVIVRRVDHDVTLPSGLTLVKDCGIVINIWAVHRNPNFWGDDAQVFRPDRFIDTRQKHPAAYMAFSHGPRACLGYQYAMMSIKTALAALLRKYRILPASTGDRMAHGDKNKPIRVRFDIMMKAMDNFAIQLQPRFKI